MKSLFGIILVMSVSLVFAQNTAVDKKAKETLAASSKAYQAIKGAHIKFDQSVLSDLTGKTQKVSGELWVGQKDEFKLKIPGLTLVSDGVNLWEFRESTQQVLVKSLLDLDRAFHPSQVLFKYLNCAPISSKEVKIDGKSYIEMLLDPKGKIKGVSGLKVWLNPKSLFPYKIETIDAVDNVTTYVIPNFKVLSGSNSSEFEFKTPEGVEVIDMR
jgi:outer membrane lipoprotein-sorting protein